MDDLVFGDEGGEGREAKQGLGSFISGNASG
jgi:hypothetical protein